jgi:hypothetical protein
MLADNQSFFGDCKQSGYFSMVTRRSVLLEEGKSPTEMVVSGKP